jgi:hypothetical protein
MELHFLQAADDTPLTKTIRIDAAGWVDKDPYPFISRFNSYKHEVETLDQFLGCLNAHANQGHCLVKGELTHSLMGESRAGTTRPEAETRWICVDIDRPKGFTSIAQFIREALPAELQDVSHIVQYSSSHSLSDDLSAHLFYMLAQPISAPMLKTWLTWINLQSPLAEQLSLSVNGATLKYPVDITTCQNDKLLYIAPPTIIDQRPDAQPLVPEIELVAGSRSHIPLRIDPGLVSMVDDMALERTKALRKKMGMKLKTPKFTMMQGKKVMTNPGRAHVTGAVKQERGFTYLNINGGDSYAYWHPDDNPSFLHNFKGEPIYLTQTFLPDYWERVKTNEGITHARVPIVFRDIKSDTYWNGIHDPNENSLSLHRTSSKDKLRDFMTQQDHAPCHCRRRKLQDVRPMAGLDISATYEDGYSVRPSRN